MRSFDEIYDIAATRKGGADALEAMLEKPKSAEALAAIPEDRWLAEISKYVFRTGLAWQVIDNKWPGFEQAFHGFDVGRCAFMDDEVFDNLLTDTRIVRSGPKIASVRDNAAFFLELREEGGVGKVLGGWPSEDFVGLLDMLKKRAAGLAGKPVLTVCACWGATVSSCRLMWSRVWWLRVLWTKPRPLRQRCARCRMRLTYGAVKAGVR